MSAWREKQRTFFRRSDTWLQKQKKKERLAAVSLRRTHLAKLLINDSKLEVVADHVLIKGDNEPWCLRMRELRVYRISLGADVVSVEKVITGKVSVKCCCLPSGRGQDKTYPRLLLHKQAGSGKKSTISFSHFLNVQKNIFQLYIPRDTLAIWTTLGNSVRQEMGITSWKVLNFVLKGKETVWKVRMLAVQLLIQRTPPAALMIFFFSVGALHSCKRSAGSKGTFPIDAVCGWVYNDLYIWCVWAKIAWERVKWESLVFTVFWE